MEENNKSLTSAPAEAEAEIDLLELAQKLWAERKLILKWCGIAAIVGLVVAFSIPQGVHHRREQRTAGSGCDGGFVLEGVERGHGGVGELDLPP